MSQSENGFNELAGVAGIVLAGGLSRRMGQDKAELPLDGTSMLEYVARALSAICGAGVFVVTSAGGPQYALRQPVQFLHDRHPDRGPLEGLCVGLQAARECRAALVTSCDTPFVSPQLLSALATKLMAGDADAVVIHDGQRLHPLTAAYRPGVYAMAQSLMEQQRYSLHGLLDHISTQQVDRAFAALHDPDLRSLLNVNSPEDYAKAMRLRKAKS